ncbi:MAG: (2Fe-2S) ferredoxin domain-containing protein [Comamonas sp.]
MNGDASTLTAACMPMTETVSMILLGRGGVGSAAKQELQALAEQLKRAALKKGQTLLVCIAFIDRTEPSLPEALDALLASASLPLKSIAIVPVFGPDEPALRRWMHKVVMRWRARFSAAEPLPSIAFTAPLLQTAGIEDLLFDKVYQAEQHEDVVTVVGDEDWQADPKGWSLVPEHQHHVLWCTGPRCAAKGALSLWPKLGQMVREDPVLKKKFMLLQTSCQYPCNHGPLMIVYPEGRWYGNLDETEIQDILRQQTSDGLRGTVEVIKKS